jgi:hypothetical protein
MKPTHVPRKWNMVIKCCHFPQNFHFKNIKRGNLMLLLVGTSAYKAGGNQRNLTTPFKIGAGNQWIMPAILAT